MLDLLPLQLFSLFISKTNERMVSMPKKANGEFNQKNYIAEWKRKNMKYVSAAFKSEFVEEFREACKKLNVKLALARMFN